jgi:hypothetical protein
MYFGFESTPIMVDAVSLIEADTDLPLPERSKTASPPPPVIFCTTPDTLHQDVTFSLSTIFISLDLFYLRHFILRRQLRELWLEVSRVNTFPS